MAIQIDTQIPVSSGMRDRLRAYKRGADRYEDVLERMIEQYDPEKSSDTGETTNTQAMNGSR